MKQYFINEEITLKANTLGLKDGTLVKLELIMLESYYGSKLKIKKLENKDFEEIELHKSKQNIENNDELKIEDNKNKIKTFKKVIKKDLVVENGIVKYSFKIEEEVEKEDIKKVNYIIGWIDLDGDGIREYDEAVIIKINHRLEKGTLRIGIFFDGTGNDISNTKLEENALSNVRKLFEVYPNPLIETSEKDRDRYKDLESKIIVTNEEIFPQTMCAYVRGVGSISSTSDKDWFTGGGFGSGGEKRLKGMLHYVNIAIEEYVKENIKQHNIEYYPKNLEFDIFGFSRGAALARHFVNHLKYHGVTYDKELIYESRRVKIRTLNVFDTVASFGIPLGDGGYSFNINSNFILDKVNHFLADDEFRENFPAHLIIENDENYPIDIKDTKFEELVLLGAHSDIGGGYPHAKLEHNVINNELSKYYLKMMYDRCKESGIPLNEMPKDINWKYNEEISEHIKYFNNMYKTHPNLKIAHKKLREIQSYLSYGYIENQIFALNQKISAQENNSSDSYWQIKEKIDDIKNEIKDLKGKYYNYESINKDLYNNNNYIEVLDELLNIFKNKTELEEFINLSNYFQDKYVHRSYTKSIGMSPRKKDMKYHRKYLVAESKKTILNLEAEIFYSQVDTLENNKIITA